MIDRIKMEILDSKTFVKEYLDKRGLSEDQSCAASRKADACAKEAREHYKIERDADAIACGEYANSCDVERLTDGGKYTQRKLSNNKSAAAARVYKEVRHVENAHALKVNSERLEQYEKESSELKWKLSHIKNTNRTLLNEKENIIKALEKKISELKSRLSSSSFSTHFKDDAAAIDDALGNS